MHSTRPGLLTSRDHHFDLVRVEPGRSVGDPHFGIEAKAANNAKPARGEGRSIRRISALARLAHDREVGMSALQREDGTEDGKCSHGSLHLRSFLLC